MFRLGYGKAELYKVKVNLAACTSFSASLLSFVPSFGLGQTGCLMHFVVLDGEQN